MRLPLIVAHRLKRHEVMLWTSRGLAERQAHVERGASAELALERDAAAMSVDNEAAPTSGRRTAAE